MKSLKLTLVHAILAGVVGAAVLMVNDHASFTSGNLVSAASARIGRPLTPLSYAGVARRTTRRAYYGAAAAGAVAGAAYGAAATAGSGCVQVTDAYGRIYTRCY
jgi:hypothetical protein